jgi:hypothetical protein
VLRVDGPVLALAWCPRPGLSAIAAAVGRSLLLLDLGAALSGREQLDSPLHGAAARRPLLHGLDQC